MVCLKRKRQEKLHSDGRQSIVRVVTSRDFFADLKTGQGFSSTALPSAPPGGRFGSYAQSGSWHVKKFWPQVKKNQLIFILRRKNIYKEFIVFYFNVSRFFFTGKGQWIWQKVERSQNIHYFTQIIKTKKSHDSDITSVIFISFFSATGAKDLPQHLLSFM